MKPRSVVLDSSALIAHAKGEPGAENVRRIMLEANGRLHMHAINTVEVAYHLYKFGLPPLQAFGLAAPENIQISEKIDRPLWQRSAVLKTEHPNLALGDCIAIAFAESKHAELITGDRLFETVETTAVIKLFR